MALCSVAKLGALCMVLLLVTAADASRPHPGEGHGNQHGHGSSNSGHGYAFQGMDAFETARPKDTTPMHPTTAGKYAIAHRGSSGELPEETAEAYRQAIALGADFVECDTVLTKDGHLILRHEPNLSNTTNAQDLFPDRVKTYVIDFLNSTGVHAIDLTLAEIRTVRARQRLYSRDQSYNDLFKLLELGEYLDLVKSAKRVVGAYVETKHPTWHDSFKLKALHGKSMTQLYVEVLQSRGYGGKLNSKQWLRQPIFMETFEINNAKEMNRLTDLPVVQLMDDVNAPIPDQGIGKLTPTGGSTPDKKYGELMTDAGLKKVAKYADAIGPYKGSLAPIDANRVIHYTTNLVERAHKHGLNVHPYTYRNEPINFATNFNPPTIMSEFELTLEELGADGAFADFVEAEVAYLKFRRQNSSFPKRQIFPQKDTSVDPSAGASN